MKDKFGMGDFVQGSFPVPANPIMSMVNRPATPVVIMVLCEYCKTTTLDMVRCSNCGAPKPPSFSTRRGEEIYNPYGRIL